MKQDAISQTCERIIEIIDREIAKKDGIEVHLENFMDECKSSKQRPRLHIIHKGTRASRIVSDCLSPSDIGRIHETVAKDCEARQVKYR